MNTGPVSPRGRREAGPMVRTLSKAQTGPCASIAFATLMNPAIFAPRT